MKGCVSQALLSLQKTTVPLYESNSLRDYGEIELDGKTLEGSDTRQRTGEHVEMAVLQRLHFSWHIPGCSCKPHSKSLENVNEDEQISLLAYRLLKT